MSTRSLFGLSALFVAAALAASGCSDDDDTVVVIPPSMVASDFQSIADYLDSQVVRTLFKYMPRYQGGIPPSVAGLYAADGLVTKSSFVPGGTPVFADFCFGTPAGASLVVEVKDPSVVDAGASSFIEGTGDRFTVYTAFKSVQLDDRGNTCEIHEVNVFSGRRNVDGSFSDLYIGQGLVGILGPCNQFLFPGDYQVSRNTALRVGDSCAGDPGGGPSPGNVLVGVENNLVVKLLVYINNEALPRLTVAPLSIDAFEAPPGFQLDFETVLPSAGLDEFGQPIPMGEIASGLFPVDLTPANGDVLYSIVNQIGTDIYFAPLPLNYTSFDIYSVVNLGLNIPGYPLPVGSGLDCFCSMAPNIDPYVIGYYSYLGPGVIPAQASVRFYRVIEEGVAIKTFGGPFDLDAGSGTITLLVQ